MEPEPRKPTAPRRLDLGDTHNFGRRVTRRGNRIVKPRTVVWERLLLDASSPVRSALGEIALRVGNPKAFDFLPSLDFFPAEEGPGGEVEAIQLAPLGSAGAFSAGDRAELARATGRSLALWTWLGVSDLHWENLVLGRDPSGTIIFSPVDIESLFDDLRLPTETKLLPDADPEYALVSRHASGVRRVLPYLGKPVSPQTLVAMAEAYVTALEWLDGGAAEVAAAIRTVGNLKETPIRVCLRGTGTYVYSQTDLQAQIEPLWPPLLDGELEQLDRGDIPYFFRLYGQPGIHHYYSDEDLTSWKTLPLDGDVPQLEPLLDLERGLASPGGRSLREEGLFALIAAFDDPSLSGRHRLGDFTVELTEDEIIVGFPSGDELACDRDLSDFVAGVYVPCRCGEVETVFVPAVTTCDGFDIDDL
ncbi:MAG: hypothetical protein AAGM22_23710 [Acidobacteriota bacterium]